MTNFGPLAKVEIVSGFSSRVPQFCDAMLFGRNGNAGWRLADLGASCVPKRLARKDESWCVLTWVLPESATETAGTGLRAINRPLKAFMLFDGSAERVATEADRLLRDNPYWRLLASTVVYVSKKEAGDPHECVRVVQAWGRIEETERWV